MKNSIRALYAIVMAASAVLLLSGCSSTEKCSRPSNTPVQPVEDTTKEYELRLEQYTLPENMNEITAQTVYGERLYLGGLSESGAAIAGYMDSTGEFTPLELDNSVSLVLAFCTGDTGVTALVSREARGESSGLGETDIPNFLLASYDEAGQLTSSTTLESVSPEKMLNSFLLLFFRDTYYVVSPTRLTAYDTSGSSTGSIEVDGMRTRFKSGCVAGGKLFLITGDAFHPNSSLCSLDLDSLQLEPVLVYDDISLLGTGISNGGKLLLNLEKDGVESLNSYNPNTNTYDPVLFWNDVGVTSQTYMSVNEVGDKYLAFNPYQSTINVVNLAEAHAPRTQLVLATDTERSEVSTLVNSFNASNDNYKIDIVVYDGQKNTMDQLKTRIIAGDAPDIFAFYDRSELAGFNKNHSLFNLYTCLDNDPEYSRDTIVPALLSSMASGDELYWLPYSFAVATFVAPSTIANRAGISLDELISAAAAGGSGAPVFPESMTKGILWSWMSQMSLDSFIDAENHTCDFNNPEYISLLEECNKAMDSLPAGEAVGSNSILQFELMQNIVRLSVISDSYNHEYTFVGAPSEDPAGNGSMFYTDLAFSISAACKDKDGAWEFVRSIMNPESQLTQSRFFPSVETVLSETIDAGIESGVEFFDNLYEISEKDAEKLWNLINTTTVLQNAYPDILSIVSEEADAYFGGGQTAGQAAEYTQSRVSILLVEQS